MVSQDKLGFILMHGKPLKVLSAELPYEEQTGTECRKHWWFPLDSFLTSLVPPKLQL